MVVRPLPPSFGLVFRSTQLLSSLSYMAMHRVRFLFASFEMSIRRLFWFWVERSDGVGRAGRDEGGVQVVAG